MLFYRSLRNSAHKVRLQNKIVGVISANEICDSSKVLGYVTTGRVPDSGKTQFLNFRRRIVANEAGGKIIGYVPAIKVFPFERGYIGIVDNTPLAVTKVRQSKISIITASTIVILGTVTLVMIKPVIDGSRTIPEVAADIKQKVTEGFKRVGDGYGSIVLRDDAATKSENFAQGESDDSVAKQSTSYEPENEETQKIVTDDAVQNLVNFLHSGVDIITEKPNISATFFNTMTDIVLTEDDTDITFFNSANNSGAVIYEVFCNNEIIYTSAEIMPGKSTEWDAFSELGVGVTEIKIVLYSVADGKKELGSFNVNVLKEIGE